MAVQRGEQLGQFWGGSGALARHGGGEMQGTVTQRVNLFVGNSLHLSRGPRPPRRSRNSEDTRCPMTPEQSRNANPGCRRLARPRLGGRSSGPASLVLGLPFLYDLLCSTWLTPVGRSILGNETSLCVSLVEVLLLLRKVFPGGSYQTARAQSSLSLFLGGEVVGERRRILDANRRSRLGGRRCRVQLPRSG